MTWNTVLSYASAKRVRGVANSSMSLLPVHVARDGDSCRRISHQRLNLSRHGHASGRFWGRAIAPRAARQQFSESPENKRARRDRLPLLSIAIYLSTRKIDVDDTEPSDGREFQRYSAGARNREATEVKCYSAENYRDENVGAEIAAGLQFN